MARSAVTPSRNGAGSGAAGNARAGAPAAHQWAHPPGVDGDGGRKPLWYVVRRAHADRLLTILPRADGLVLAAVNDTDAAWDVPARAVNSFVGRELAAADVRLTAPREVGIAPIPVESAVPGDAAVELLMVSAPSGRALWFFAPDKDLALPAPDFATSLRAVDGGVELTHGPSAAPRRLPVRRPRRPRPQR